ELAIQASELPVCYLPKLSVELQGKIASLSTALVRTGIARQASGNPDDAGKYFLAALRLSRQLAVHWPGTNYCNRIDELALLSLADWATLPHLDSKQILRALSELTAMKPNYDSVSLNLKKFFDGARASVRRLP